MLIRNIGGRIIGVEFTPEDIKRANEKFRNSPEAKELCARIDAENKARVEKIYAEIQAAKVR